MVVGSWIIHAPLIFGLDGSPQPPSFLAVTRATINSPSYNEYGAAARAPKVIKHWLLSLH